MEYLPDVLGWGGTILIVGAYFLVSTKKVDGGSKMYQFMNFFGALGVGVNVLYQAAWPALALQVIWGIIAIISLINIFRKK